MRLYDTPNVKMDLDETTRVILVELRGHLTETEFRAAIDFLGTVVEHKKVRKELLDTRQSGPISHAMQDYVDSAYPRLYALGLRAVAFVLPARVVAQISVELGTAHVRKAGLTATIVPTVAEARLWLANQP